MSQLKLFVFSVLCSLHHLFSSRYKSCILSNHRDFCPLRRKLRTIDRKETRVFKCLVSSHFELLDARIFPYSQNVTRCWKCFRVQQNCCISILFVTPVSLLTPSWTSRYGQKWYENASKNNRPGKTLQSQWMILQTLDLCQNVNFSDQVLLLLLNCSIEIRNASVTRCTFKYISAGEGVGRGCREGVWMFPASSKGSLQSVPTSWWKQCNFPLFSIQWHLRPSKISFFLKWDWLHSLIDLPVISGRIVHQLILLLSSTSSLLSGVWGQFCARLVNHCPKYITYQMTKHSTTFIFAARRWHLRWYVCFLIKIQIIHSWLYTVPHNSHTPWS